MVNVNPVGWFDINVANLDRAKKFYETVFNLKLTDAPIEWGKQSFFPFSPESHDISGALVEKADFALEKAIKLDENALVGALFKLFK